LYLRLLLLYRLWKSSGRKVKLAAFFVARLAGLQEDAPGAARNSVEGFGVEAPDSLLKELGPNPAGLKCDRNAVNRKE
jgi:hypothetical protein